MPDHAVTKKWLLPGLVLIIVLALAYFLPNKPRPSATPPAKAQEAKAQKPLQHQAAQTSKQPLPAQSIELIANAEKFPEAITPEGVKALIDKNTAHILVNADDPNQQNQIQGPIRAIYFTLTPSSRPTQAKVNKDRQIDPNNPAPALRPDSQRLTGTPLEWKRLGLPLPPPNSIPEQPLKITPKQLSEAIKDDVDLQIIDLRPAIPGENAMSPFPNALRWLPHEALKNMPKLSKEKWTVLVGLGGEEAQPIAFELFQKGYVLTTILEGGYPAWVNATDR